MQAVKIMRLNQNPTGVYTVASMPTHLKISGGVAVAGNTPTLNIGQIDPALMDVRLKINGTVAIREFSTSNGSQVKAHITATHIMGGNHSFIEYALPNDFAGKEVSIEIYGMDGTLFRKFMHKVLGVVNHLSWDETDNASKLVCPGSYVVRVIAGRFDLSTKFAIAR
jgi:hypothetical protein